MALAERKKIGIIGPGRVGAAFAVGLFEAGWSIAEVYGPRRENAESLAERVKAHVAANLSQLVCASDLIFLTVPDDKILGLAEEIATQMEGLHEKIFYHTSGVLEVKVLSALKKKDGLTGSIHPLQTFANRETGWKALAGTWFALEGDEVPVLIGKEMVSALSGKAFSLRSGTKPLYHAAACVASNYFVTLEYIASALFDLSGLGKEDFYSLIGPLLQKTLENIREKGVECALTGPVSRGDLGTIKLHIEKIMELAPQYQRFYEIMLQHTVELASKHRYLQRDQVRNFHPFFQSKEDKK